MTRKLISTLILATAAALPLGTMAAAGDPPAAAPKAGSSAGTPGSLDTNRDGFVSRDEAKSSADLNRSFSSLDKNGDGKLSPQELSGWKGGSPSTMGSDAK